MSTTFVTVAQRAKARLFRHDGPGKGLTEVRDLAHPASRAHGTDIDTDRPGRVHDRYGPGRHAMAKEEPPKEHEARQFAQQVAEAIREYRTKEGFDRLILVAEPRFLGMLRESLDDATAKLIDGELHKEITDSKQQEIEQHLSEVLAV
jgi:protein required for attachment to host cells